MEAMDTAEVPLQPRAAGCQVPLTATQLRWWNAFIERGRWSASRLSLGSVHIRGALDVSALRWSLDAVVQRHDSLRTRIVAVDGVPTQHVDSVMECALEIVDLVKVSPADIDIEARRRGEEFLSETIDVSAGPLFATKLFRLSSDEHVLVLAVDHIVSDAISCDILSREIWTLYGETIQGVPSSLPQLPLQFVDYAVWQEKTYDAWFKKHAAYWRERLTGAPSLELPFDGDCSWEDRCHHGIRTSVARDGGTICTSLELSFGETLSAKLRHMAGRERTLLPVVILAVYVAVVSHWCNQRDVVLAFVLHGRHRYPQLENMIGFLASRLHLRIKLAYGDNFIDLLKQVNLEFCTAYQHQDLDRVPDFVPECNAQIQFNWLPGNWTRRASNRATEWRGPLQISPFPIQGRQKGAMNGWPSLPVAFSDGSAGIVMTVGYRSDLFKSNTISRFAQNVRSFAEEVTASPPTSIESIMIRVA